MDSLERITQQRTIALALYAGSFAAWQLTQLDLWASANGNQWLNVLAPVFIILWLISTSFLIWQSRKHGSATDGDELTRLHHSTAIKAGYWSAIVATALGLIAAPRLAVSTQDLLRTILVVAVAVPVLTYVVLERDQ